MVAPSIHGGPFGGCPSIFDDPPPDSGQIVHRSQSRSGRGSPNAQRPTIGNGSDPSPEVDCRVRGRPTPNALRQPFYLAIPRESNPPRIPPESPVGSPRTREGRRERGVRFWARPGGHFDNSGGDPAQRPTPSLHPKSKSLDDGGARRLETFGATVAERHPRGGRFRDRSGRVSTDALEPSVRDVPPPAEVDPRSRWPWPAPGADPALPPGRTPIPRFASSHHRGTDRVTPWIRPARVESVTISFSGPPQ
jgi:hypothetical protein